MLVAQVVANLPEWDRLKAEQGAAARRQPALERCPLSLIVEQQSALEPSALAALAQIDRGAA